MRVNILGQINSKGTGMHIYQFPNPSTKDDAYFGHLEVMPFLLTKGGVDIASIDTLFDSISVTDVLEIPSSKDETTRHIFIKAEAFGELSKLDIFTQPNWRDLIHPITLNL